LDGKWQQGWGRGEGIMNNLRWVDGEQHILLAILIDKSHSLLGSHKRPRVSKEEWGSKLKREFILLYHFNVHAIRIKLWFMRVKDILM